MFDERHLLDTAQELFWARGYDRTSLEELATASGVGTSSLYAIYGSKFGLFLAVFRRYCEGRVDFVAETTSDPSDDVAAAAARYLERIVAECTSYADRRGCLMLNSIVELSDRFPEVRAIGQRTTEEMEGALAGKLREVAATRSRRISAADARRVAERIVLASQGLIQLSRLGVSAERLRVLAARSCSSLATIS